MQQAVNAELAAERSDHSLWLYRESDKRPGDDVLQWVAETNTANVIRVLEKNGNRLPIDEQRRHVMQFIHDPGAQAKQRANGEHDDNQAEALLRMLPAAFRWSIVNTTQTTTTLQFQPNSGFHPPTREARVFAAMAGEMVVENAHHRIRTFEGRMIHDVTFGLWGILGKLDAGGNFDVERRETGEGVWQITQTHVHIQGHALLFKTISEQEDDVRSDFRRLPNGTDLQQAADLLMQQPE